MNSFVISTGNSYYFINRSSGYICNVDEVFFAIFDYSLNHSDSEVIDFYSSKYERKMIKKNLVTIRYY